jgi:GNAT superfamily N-acetyltransferase
MDPTITTELDGIDAQHLRGGFFDGWPAPPSAERHLALLRGSLAAAVAIDPASGEVVGFATAVGDGVLCAYVPLLEVLPAWRGSGLGTRLVEALVERVSPVYMLDVACDDDVVPFYERLGFTRTNAMIRRDYSAQAGRA